MENETNTIKEDMKVTVKNAWDRTDAITWTERFKEIIDISLDSATTLDEFIKNMKKENVMVHKGVSLAHGSCFIFNLNSSEKIIRKRSTMLGEGYSYDDIMKKIESNSVKKNRESGNSDEERNS